MRPIRYEIGWVDTTRDDPLAARKIELAKKVGAVLAELYPHHPWRLYPTIDGTCLYVMNDGLAMRQAYVLHTANLEAAPDFRARVMRAGGEILERFGVSRAPRIDFEAEYGPHQGLVFTR